MRRAADRKQRHDSTVLRQAIERARAQRGDALHQRRIDAVLGSKAHISAAQCVESDRQTARGRAGQRSQEVGRERKGDEWAPAIDSTQLRTMANASTAATTAPKPTRLATLSIGSTDALAPASTVRRSPGSRCQLTMTTVT